MTTQTVQENDQMLGYTLLRKIGSGGYGDVWEAEAPGGLKKAVKIIYGFHDEKRAQTELKSLGRIKEARHPFLLSLERIEIFNSQLIVVSELADKSLSELANYYVEQGESGIPRDELIRYMQEAADALDYLNLNFGLQHLDIKPENILLVSGHAKVADFGLVKDLRDVSQSMMSGLTPAYAAPELFDGHPGTASDQYSLANVYQEMLTMVRPFSGTTPAQLAAQHMHGKPDLRPLPISDQPVVAKALSKEPGDRYKSCGQFIEQLSSRKTRKKVVRSRVTVRDSVETDCKTVIVDAAEQANEQISSGKLTFNSVDLDSLPPPECDPETSTFQPTLVIGLGGSACQVIEKTKQRLVARYGASELVPSFGLLCVDSDRDSLAKLSADRGQDSISVSETLAVPLRRSEQYRQHKKLDLSWISRRWIYNVPRSLQTDGLRPLGRLVFADHFDAICEKISASIREIIKPENLATSCETLGINPPTTIRPRIIVVSNISGGIGSGMTIDLAYTARLMLAESGLNETEIVGLLMHGHRPGREVSLATANAYAFLCELRHFADGGYPGDVRLGIPEFEDDLPFDFTYGLRLHADSDGAMSDLDRIAEYVCLSNLTRCSVFFDANRKREEEQEEFALRSFGISVCGPGKQVQGREAVERLCRGLIDHWIGESTLDGFDAHQFAKTCSRNLGLSLEQAASRSIIAVSAMEDWDSVAAFRKAAPGILLGNPPESFFQQMEEHFDAFFDAPQWRTQSVGTATDLCLSAQAEISAEGQIVGDELSTRLLNLLNGTQVSFAVARQAISECRSIIEQQHELVMKGLHSFGSRMQRMKQLFAETGKKSAQRKNDPKFLQTLLDDYSEVRFQEFNLRCCSDFYRIIKSCLSSTEEIMKTFAMQIKAVGSNFGNEPETKLASRTKPTIQQLLLDSVDANRDQLIRQLESIVLESIASDGTEFLDVLSDSMNWQHQLPGVIRDAAQSVLSNAFKSISIDEVISRHSIEPKQVKSWLNGMLNEAVPFVTDCGGGATLLLGQPANARRSILPSVVSDCFDVQLKEISGTTGDLVLCFEAEKILLANFAFSILKEAPEAAELVKRIHSRGDIDWTSLADLM